MVKEKVPGRQISINLIFHGVFSRKLRKFNSSTTLSRKKITFLYVAKIHHKKPILDGPIWTTNPWSRIRLDHGNNTVPTRDERTRKERTQNFRKSQTRTNSNLCFVEIIEQSDSRDLRRILLFLKVHFLLSF